MSYFRILVEVLIIEFIIYISSTLFIYLIHYINLLFYFSLPFYLFLLFYQIRPEIRKREQYKIGSQKPEPNPGYFSLSSLVLSFFFFFFLFSPSSHLFPRPSPLFLPPVVELTFSGHPTGRRGPPDEPQPPAASTQPRIDANSRGIARPVSRQSRQVLLHVAAPARVRPP